MTRVWSVGLTRTHGDDMANVLHVNVWSNALTRGVVRWPTLDSIRHVFGSSPAVTKRYTRARHRAVDQACRSIVRSR